jgi:hypothetical protein
MLVKLKMTVLAPMASARVRTMMKAYPGWRRTIRAPYRRS